MKKHLYRIMLILVLLAGTGTLRSEEAKIEARLNPERITLGESAELQVSISGGGGEPKLPEVDGLRFIKVSQSQQMQMINFNVSVQNNIGYQVQASKPGEYQIPPIQLVLEGNKTLQTQPLKLSVLKSAAPPPDMGGGGEAQLPHNEQDQLIFVRLSKLPEKMYSGQVVPVTIRVCIRNGMNVQNLNPKINGEAFSIKPLEFHRSQEQIQNVPYEVFTASTTLAAVKQGTYPVSASAEMVVLMREKLSNDDFMGSIFQQLVPKQISRESAAQSVEVLPLPEQNKPASFAGAIGRFEMSVKATPDEVHVGDPLTLSMQISGIGNFDHVSAPVLAPDSAWKTYTAGGHFTPSDASGYDGKKIFDQPLIPQSTSIKSLPAVEFSYFDPVESKYVVLKPEPPVVRLLGAAGNSASGLAASAPGPAPVTPPVPNPPQGSILLPNQIEIGALSQNLRPVFRQPWFWTLQSIPLSLALAGFFLFWRYRLHVTNPIRKLRREQDRHWLELETTMDEARRNGDSAHLAQAGCRLLRERLARTLGTSPENISPDNLRAGSLPQVAGLTELLELGDAVSYSGRRLSSAEMDDFIQRIKTLSTGIQS